MKNLYILQTDQPSRLHYYFELNKRYVLSKKPLNWRTASHIYITSSEDIKEGDWLIYNNKLYKDSKRSFTGVDYSNCKKIILTTDPTLIADGVQAIDDEFLEWFVKNPTCEFVEVNKKLVEFPLTFKMMYKIIIPQEEPKQEKKPHSFCETPEEKCTMNYCDDNGCQNRKRHLVEPHEQETLEELKSFSDFSDKFFGTNEKEEPKQTEIRYSEQEVLDLLYKRDLYLLNRDETKELELPTEWFENFKKK